MSVEPYDFHSAAEIATSNSELLRTVGNATLRQYRGREEKLAELPDADSLRWLASKIKDQTLASLDKYLEQAVDAIEASGGHVHFAKDGDQAVEIIREIAVSRGLKRCVKSKSMAAEEIDLTPPMERAGVEMMETDLGEFILQLDQDKPSHIVAPVCHKSAADIARTFERELNIPYTEDPATLTKAARTYLRPKFRDAELGITGGNFIVAETGTTVLVTNEGNGRMCTSTPRVLVSLVGIEKLVPTLDDMMVMLKLLARSATGQPLTVYTTMITGPRRKYETDGPEEFHLVLLDNGRSKILASKYRETLRCIRCGACLNACPVYRKVGGHTYGEVYSGPIGALLTPLFNGMARYKALPQASSLCGSCFEACPVKIQIPEMLIEMRRDQVEQSVAPLSERIVMHLYGAMLRRPWLYRLSARMGYWLSKPFAHNGRLRWAPPPIGNWTKMRDLPAPAAKPFHLRWKALKDDR